MAQAQGMQLGMTFLDGTNIRAHRPAAGAAQKGAAEPDALKVKLLADLVVALSAVPTSLGRQLRSRHLAKVVTASVRLSISIVNPARIEACGASELLRNKTDRRPTPASRLVGDPSAHLRELRELVRRCDALKAAHVQELDHRQRGLCLTRRGSVDG